MRTVRPDRPAERGISLSPHAAGAALIGCPLLVAAAALPFPEAVQLSCAGLALVLLGAGVTALRVEATGVGLPWALLAVMALVVALEVLGTLFQISGVAIAVPLGLAVAAMLFASRWRAGDLGLLAMAMGLGFAVAYVLDNVVHSDNGSQTDQAVPLVVFPGVGLALWALARASWLPKAARACVALGFALTLVAFVVALATRNKAFVPVAVAALLLVGYGLVSAGLVVRSAPERANPGE